MRLKTKLMIASSTVIALAFVASLVFWWAIERHGARLQTVTWTQELARELGRLRALVYEYRFERTPTVLHAAGVQYRRTSALAASSATEQLGHAVGDDRAVVDKSIDQIGRALDELERLERDSVASAAWWARIGGLLASLDEANEAVDKFVRSAEQQLEDHERNTELALMTAVLLLVITTLTLIWLVNRAVFTPIERLATATRLFARGDRTARAALPGRDELALLAADFDLMADEIQANLSTTEQLATDLQRSNEELAYFAYIASHDLQEPLRTISSYLQLIERRHAEEISPKARELMAFAVDGARRMQEMVTGLLLLSRVTTRGAEFESIALNDTIDEVRADLADLIAQTHAQIVVDRLPEIRADRAQMRQLFQNLLANSIKFRRVDAAPKIVVQAQRELGEQPAWQISVIDNGIGIEPAYAERVFQIFQRLHLRDEYPGVGIGLAVCRRIVERHGGTIRAHPADQGACIEVRLPDPVEDAPAVPPAINAVSAIGRE